MQVRLSIVDKDKAEARYIKMSTPFLKDDIAGVERLGDDVIVDGRSLRQLIRTVSEMENKIVEYVKLLVPADGTLDDLTYEEIEAEWPTQVQMELLEAISSAIQPGYKDARKN
jgi:bisphosphoglycerate-dependent phosphoglycerate mutase